MKRKKLLLVISILVLSGVVIGLFFIISGAFSTVNHAVRVSELLQPMLVAENQAMHISVTAEVDGDAFGLESDIFLVSEDGVPYLVVQQNAAAIYVSEGVLFLENGKAFNIGDTMQTPMESYADLLPQIGSLFEVLKITAQETDRETAYSITVTGEQVQTLLAVASLGDAIPVEGIEKLNLQLTERNNKLDCISFSGSGNLSGTVVQLELTISDLRILAAGDYPIPEVVKHSKATVNPETLFSLTEDLYRLLPALASLADMEALDGTLELTADCGLLQLDTKIDLSDLSTSSNSGIDPENLQALPEMLGWLCMEGDISCTYSGSAYVYTLALDEVSMQELPRMILPELGQYTENLTAGSASMILEAGKITSMQVSIEGKIRVLFAQVPITASARFTFD